MCISYKLYSKAKKKWLKTQPDIITAYKCVYVREYYGTTRFFPIVYSNSRNKPFKRKNTLREIESKQSDKRTGTYFQEGANRTVYIAYYHLYLNREDAESWVDSDRKIIKCTVPKKCITDIGLQNGVVIITKQFSIVGEDEYLD